MNYPQVRFNDIPKTLKTAKIKKFLSEVLSELQIDNWKFTVLFCGDDFIHELNKNYRGKDEPTDVLTFAEKDEIEKFPVQEAVFYAGDIVISLDMLEKNSEYFNVSKNEELKRLLIHGILHLNGMDHENNDADQEMLIFQEKILYKFSGVILS